MPFLASLMISLSERVFAMRFVLKFIAWVQPEVSLGISSLPRYICNGTLYVRRELWPTKCFMNECLCEWVGVFAAMNSCLYACVAVYMRVCVCGLVCRWVLLQRNSDTNDKRHCQRMNVVFKLHNLNMFPYKVWLCHHMVALSLVFYFSCWHSYYIQ